MARTQAEFFDFLASLGITVTTVSHPPLYTVAESQALRGEIAGGHQPARENRVDRQGCREVRLSRGAAHAFESRADREW